MTIKASILISSYEKENELPNVFYSISRQKTNFDFEVCFVDDCSYIDPKSIYDKYLKVPNKKGVRFKQHVGCRGGGTNPRFGFINSMGYAYKMRDPESKLMILQSSDVMWTQDDILQKLVDGSKDKIIPAPHVKNMMVPSNLHEDWDNQIETIKKKSESAGEYQGPTREVVAWLVPLPVEILEATSYIRNQGEYHITKCAMARGYKHVHRPDMLAIHQAHRSIPMVHVASDDCLVNWGPQHPEKVFYD